MVKYDLRQQGYSVEEYKPKQSILTMIWVFLTLFLLAGAIFSVYGFFLFVLGMDGATLDSARNNYFFANYIANNFLAFWFLLTFFLFIHLALRLIMTLIVCNDKIYSIKIKMLVDKAMPVCHCREALTIRQTVLIYFVPFFVTYSLMIALCILTLAEPFFILLFLFLSFFLAFDLIVVIYVLIFKKKYKIDYIALDHHIYEVTFYKQTFVKFGRKSAKRKIKQGRNTYTTKIFTEIIVCGNQKCENYEQKLDENVKICPICKKTGYKTKILSNVITCVNPECENFGQELKQELTNCSLCGMEIGQMALKFRR